MLLTLEEDAQVVSINYKIYVYYICFNLLERIIVIGGQEKLPVEVKSLDVYSHSKTCSTPLNIELTKSTGQVLDNGEILICQGVQCFNLNQDGQLRSKYNMTNHLDFAASFSHNNQLHLLGGVE